jgi:valine--pyruvate aminotransferase
MQFSRFGSRLGGNTGIVQLMDDLGDALRTNPDMIFMGGGNPARIPEMEFAFTEALKRALADPQESHHLLGVYQPPQGDVDVLDALAQMLNDEYGWPLSRKNIALSNGSQSAFFVLFNMFAGEFDQGVKKQIKFPLAPEYLGYNDLGLGENFFSASRPKIELLEKGFFKYRIDFSQLHLSANTGAICVSRPTNPTGNVLSDEELHQLSEIAVAQRIPLMVDGAYGTPFPNILFTDIKPHWNENTILVLSLSKLGLPGVRTGIVIATEEVIETFARANTILNLASGNLGPTIARHLLKNKQILKLSRDLVAPFYKSKMEAAVQIFKQALGDLAYRLHRPEGAIFLWLWFKDLPISSEELYQRLKARGVLVISGHHFFAALEEDWRHSHECIRVTYCQDAQVIAKGAAIIAEEVKKAFVQG